MVKTVFDAKTGELLGAHMIGAEVTELIQGYAIARTLESTEAELMETVFPHPTVVGDDARGGAGCVWAGDTHLSELNGVTRDPMGLLLTGTASSVRARMAGLARR